MKGSATALIVGTLATALAAEPALFRANARHDGNYDAAGVPVLHGVKWKFRAAGPIVSTPAVSGGTVYFGSSDTQLYALDEHSGALLWKFTTEGERRFSARHLHGAEPAAEVMPDPFDVFLSSPAIAGGLIYFGSGDGNVYALDAASGALRWKFHTGNVVHASPAVAAGTLYVGSWDSYFYALDAATGKQRWRFKTGEDPAIHNQEGIQSSAVVADGMLYFGTSDSGLVHALDARSGREIFSLDFKHWPFFSSPTLAGDYLYIGSHQGKLLAINLKTRQLAWSFATEGAQKNGPTYTKADGTPNYRAAAGDSFYDQMVIGLDRMMSVGAVLSTPVIDGDTLFFGSWTGSCTRSAERAEWLQAATALPTVSPPTLSSTRATACTVAAMRTALCTASRETPCWRSCRSCEATQVPQPLIADTARASSSKSALAMPGLPMTFMRRRAGSFAYSGSSTRCRKR